jgi:hypothetical protein
MIKHRRVSTTLVINTPRACPADHAGDAGSGTLICGVVVGCRRSASTPSSALQWTHQTPLTCAYEAPLLPSDLIRRTGPRRDGRRLACRAARPVVRQTVRR